MIQDFLYAPSPKIIRYPYVITYGMILSVLFFIMHLYSIAPLAYLGCCMLAFTLFSFSEKEQFIFITLLTPNLFMFKFLESPFAILGYFFMVVCFKYLLVNFHYVKINPYLFVFFCSSLLTSIYWSDLNFLTASFRFVLNFFLFFSLAQFFEKKEIDSIMIVYMFGTILMILFAIIFYMKIGNLYFGAFGGINCGRNYTLAVVSPIFSMIVLFFMECHLNVEKNIFLLTTLITCFICLILSASRTATIALLFPILLMISYLYQTKIKYKQLGRCLLLFLILTCILFFLFKQYADSINYLVDRFGKDDFEGGSGRFDIWMYYYDRFTDNIVSFLIGNGSVYEENVIAEHNSIIQCLNQAGIIGFSSMLLLFFSVFFSFLKSAKFLYYRSLTPLFVALFCYLGISAFLSDQVSFLFILSLLVAKNFSTSPCSYIKNRSSL